MKKLALCIVAAFLLFAVLPTTSKADVVPVKISNTRTTSIQTSQSSVLINRLETIKDMDMSKLNQTEKNQLRTEVVKIRTQLLQDGGGLYISVGALIIIVLLLVIFL